MGQNSENDLGDAQIKFSFSQVITTYKLFLGCLTVRISLKNELLNQYGFLLGDYQKTKKAKQNPGWVNGENSIRYQPSTNVWMIGRLSEIGSTLVDIITLDHFSGLIAIENEWLYHDGNNWISISDSKDVSVGCLMLGKCSKHSAYLWI